MDTLSSSCFPATVYWTLLDGCEQSIHWTLDTGHLILQVEDNSSQNKVLKYWVGKSLTLSFLSIGNILSEILGCLPSAYKCNVLKVTLFKYVDKAEHITYFLFFFLLTLSMHYSLFAVWVRT